MGIKVENAINGLEEVKRNFKRLIDYADYAISVIKEQEDTIITLRNKTHRIEQEKEE